MLLLGAMTCAVAPLLQTTQVLLATTVPAGATVLLQLASGADFSSRPLVGVWYGLCVGSAALTYKWSVWMLTLVWDVHRSRDLEARLAVAEERLRFSRDLHDTLGRNLSLISITTELAARSSGSPETLTRHLEEIRLVCGDSIRDMREVVHGYRGTDLATELAGARSLLMSAGVRVRIIGDFETLPRELQTALGWIVREAVTNIIRHSDATNARIELNVGPIGTTPERYVTLQVENDGCRPPGTDRTIEIGAGLTGLTERLRERDGNLSTRQEDGWFHLLATIPIRHEQLVDQLQPGSTT